MIKKWEKIQESQNNIAAAAADDDDDQHTLIEKTQAHFNVNKHYKIDFKSGAKEVWSVCKQKLEWDLRMHVKLPSFTKV